MLNRIKLQLLYHGHQTSTTARGTCTCVASWQLRQTTPHAPLPLLPVCLQFTTTTKLNHDLKHTRDSTAAAGRAADPAPTREKYLFKHDTPHPVIPSLASLALPFGRPATPLPRQVVVCLSSFEIPTPATLGRNIRSGTVCESCPCRIPSQAILSEPSAPLTSWPPRPARSSRSWLPSLSLLRESLRESPPKYDLPSRQSIPFVSDPSQVLFSDRRSPLWRAVHGCVGWREWTLLRR